MDPEKFCEPDVPEEDEQQGSDDNASSNAALLGYWLVTDNT